MFYSAHGFSEGKWIITGILIPEIFHPSGNILSFFMAMDISHYLKGHICTCVDS
ncbi:hypothetical protein [Citrobacter sp. FR21RM1OL9030]|uniref:hypothetical protein n=1 Tax=Citrobacter sp. FR21RM1OL9030 TaxID=3381297 RepID=UPI0029CACFC0|nr:hypothetical protein [Citrobacter koseri]HEJ0423599.1 hypothetical protein [Citrobacter koseri]